MRYSIDRVEGGLAVCEREDGALEHVALGELPEGAREGSVLRRDCAGAWTLDPEAEQERRAKLYRMQEELFGGGKL